MIPWFAMIKQGYAGGRGGAKVLELSGAVL